MQDVSSQQMASSPAETPARRRLSLLLPDYERRSPRLPLCRRQIETLQERRERHETSLSGFGKQIAGIHFTVGNLARRVIGMGEQDIIVPFFR